VCEQHCVCTVMQARCGSGSISSVSVSSNSTFALRAASSIAGAPKVMSYSEPLSQQAPPSALEDRPGLSSGSVCSATPVLTRIFLCAQAPLSRLEEGQFLNPRYEAMEDRLNVRPFPYSMQAPFFHTIAYFSKTRRKTSAHLCGILICSVCSGCHNVMSIWYLVH
jgi:hypothetical protein